MVIGSRTGPSRVRRLAVAALAVTAALASASCSKDELAQTDEGFHIEPAGEVGPHAFTPSVAAGDVQQAMGAAPDDGESAAADPPACDTDKFLTELQKRPDAYREWARVLGLRQDEVPGYVAGLKTAVLPDDTKITNHGLRDGKAYARPSVLKAGTAVLVDADGGSTTTSRRASTTTAATTGGTAPGGGVIVTRCKCGNPLLPPVADPKTIDTNVPVPETPGSSAPGTTSPGTGSRGTTPGSASRSATTAGRSTTTRSGATTTSSDDEGPEPTTAGSR